jgi:hypothetical protein
MCMSDVSRDADAPEESATGESGSRESSTATGGRPCPRCERPMYHRHCKYVCPEHGVVFDCADTFY